MYLITSVVKVEEKGSRSCGNIDQLPIRPYMDDLTFTTKSHMQAGWVLKALEKTALWAGMEFKSAMSRCIVLKRGKLIGKFELRSRGNQFVHRQETWENGLMQPFGIKGRDLAQKDSANWKG
jgi:hypothetical protein